MPLPSADQSPESDHQFKAGRPRSEESRRAILESTRRLLTHMSVQKISIEAIAKKAGVGKTTIYRWWPNKQAVVMEAVFHQPGFQNFLPHATNAADGVRAQIDKLCRQLSGKNGRLVAEIIGECQGEPEILKSLIDTFFQDRYNTLAKYIAMGRDDGTFRENTDLEVAIDVVLGPIVFRLMSGQNLDDSFTKKLTEMAINALSAPQGAAQNAAAARALAQPQQAIPQAAAPQQAMPQPQPAPLPESAYGPETVLMPEPDMPRSVPFHAQQQAQQGQPQAAPRQFHQPDTSNKREYA